MLYYTKLDANILLVHHIPNAHQHSTRKHPNPTMGQALRDQIDCRFLEVSARSAFWNGQRALFSCLFDAPPNNPGKVFIERFACPGSGIRGMIVALPPIRWGHLVWLLLELVTLFGRGGVVFLVGLGGRQ